MNNILKIKVINLELKKYCIGFERTKDEPTENKTMGWLNESNIAMPHPNLQAIKDLVMCMDISHQNYAHLTDADKKKVELLLKNEKVIDIVLVTLFRWFGSSVGTYCLKEILKEI